jgi:hypothetical protein
VYVFLLKLLKPRLSAGFLEFFGVRREAVGVTGWLGGDSLMGSSIWFFIF